MARTCRRMVMGSAVFVVAAVLAMARVGIAGMGLPSGPLDAPRLLDPCSEFNKSLADIEPDLRVEGHTLANGGCDLSHTVGHFTLHFDFVEYYVAQEVSRWQYRLTWDEVPPPLDTFGLMICRAEFLGGCPGASRIVVDPDGITWVYWDDLPESFSVTLRFQIHGLFDFQLGPTEFMVDAGTQNLTGWICGIPCGGPGGCEVEITCPDDVWLDCIDPTDPLNTGEPTVEGNCPPFEISHTDESIPGACPDEYTIERTWTVEDDMGVTDQCTQLIHVVDDTPPELTCALDDVIPCEAPVVFTEPEVSDICDPDPTVNIISTETTPGPDPYAFTHTKCWEAVDNCDNADTCCQDIYEEPCEEREYCTYTMGGWGSTCPESQQDSMMSTQPGCIRDHYFEDVYGTGGVWIGDPDHHDGDAYHAARWDSAGAVRDFLPAGSTPMPLGGDYSNPTTDQGNVLVGQILALHLNVDFSCAGIFDLLDLLPDGVSCYSGMEIPEDCTGGITYFETMNVGQFLAFADRVVSGEDVLPDGVSYSDVNFTATCLNEYWGGCGEGADQGLVVDSPTQVLLQSGSQPTPQVEQPSAEVPTEFRISSHPNPMQGSTTINYALPAGGRVAIDIYDIHGRLVTELLDAEKNAGFHWVVWNGKDSQRRVVKAGVYFCRVRIDDRPAVLEKLIKM